MSWKTLPGKPTAHWFPNGSGRSQCGVLKNVPSENLSLSEAGRCGRCLRAGAPAEKVPPQESPVIVLNGHNPSPPPPPRPAKRSARGFWLLVGGDPSKLPDDDD